MLQGGLETNSRSRMDKMPEWGKNRIEVEGGFPEDLAHMLVWMKKLEPRHSSLRDPLLEERKLRKDQLQRNKKIFQCQSSNKHPHILGQKCNNKLKEKRGKKDKHTKPKEMRTSQDENETDKRQEQKR